MRSTLALLIVVLACWASHTYSEHHVGRNGFETLYMHLVPAVLVEHGGAPNGAGAGVEQLGLGAEPGHAGVESHASGEGHGAETEHRPTPLLEVPLPSSMPGPTWLSAPILGFFRAIDYRGEVPPGDGPRTALFNLQLFQVAAALLVLVLFSGVSGYVRTGRGGGVSRILAGWAMWVRDEMVYPEMGKELGRKFLPYFLCLFFFLLFMNALGLVPFGGTATASIFVTGAMALTTLAAMVVCGMVVQGPIAFWKNLVPEVPLALWPMMFVVELIGLFVKPFALMIRLFANMTGGHMVVLSFMGFIFFAAREWSTGVAWAASPAGVGFAVFIMIIESFVALVQAFVFTQLSIIFVHASIHPEH